MLNSGKKFRALRDKKKILTFVLSEKKILNETKNHNPPLQVKWSFPKIASKGKNHLFYKVSCVQVTECISSTQKSD
jgi:hypothetical protein